MRYRKGASLALLTSMALGGLVVVDASSMSAGAAPAPSLTVVNTAPDGTKADVGFAGGSGALSSDGRYVAFISDATNLVQSDVNGLSDVFVKDRTTGAVQLVSTGADGTQGDNGVIADRPAISGDGRFVAFSSYASNMVPNDTYFSLDIFVKDRVYGSIERVDVDGVGEPSSISGAISLDQAMSSDARFVGFWSTAPDLAVGGSDGWNYYVRDRVASTTTLISHSQTNWANTLASISNDGRYVTLTEGADPSSTSPEAHLYDRATGQRTLIARNTDGSCVSGDGSTIIVATSDALDPAGTANRWSGGAFRSVYVVDRVTGAAKFVGVDSSGGAIIGDANLGNCQAISENGSVVAFAVVTSNVASDLQNGWQPFLHDLVTGRTVRLTPVRPFGDSSASGLDPAVSADGTTAVFRGWGDNLIPGYSTYRGNSLMEDLFAVNIGVIEFASSTWRLSGPVVPAYNGGVSLLGDGGIWAGGQGESGYTNEAWRYSPSQGWYSIAPMHVVRYGASAVRLQDGRILVAGGFGGAWDIPSSAEVYDPSTDEWTLTNPMVSQHEGGQIAFLLPSGLVYVTGGTNGGSSGEVYDPATNSWTPSASPGVQMVNTGTAVLADGRILAADGNSALIFDPQTWQWSVVEPMIRRRYGDGVPNLVTLPSGKVLAVGGAVFDGTRTDAEIYDPATDRWSLTPPLPDGYQVSGVSGLPDGRVLATTFGFQGPVYTNFTQIYDEPTNTWTVADRMVSYATWWDGFLLLNGDLVTRSEVYGIPRVLGRLDRQPDAPGWYNAPVTVGWAVADPSAAAPSPTTVSTEGAGQVISSPPVCDASGRCSTGTVSLSIDLSPPSVGTPQLGAPSASTPPTVDLTVATSDSLSGVAGGEWFLGVDPGVGNGNRLNLGPSWFDPRGSTLSGQINLGPLIGTAVVGVRAVDLAGNWSDPSTATVTILGGDDDDGVPSDVEAAAPNNGDGNGDGTPDSQQANVTSVPALGSSTGSTYITVAAAAGTLLQNVYTIDPSDGAQVSTPPPAGYVLPEGLTSFTAADVPAGQDSVITIYTGATAGVIGYAKYQNGTWSLLPDDRVTIYPDRVELRLTDGGIGDDDGVANGVIVDPGGPVTDAIAPDVTGAPDRQPNSAGWYKAPVTVTWTATDPAPSSGAPTIPAVTVVSAQGANQTVTSGNSCDPLHNCATGTVTLSIDTKAPTVTVNGVTDGASYTLGAVPTPTCSASDTLSGLTGACTGRLTGGNANGVGTFTYTASATDRAGNTASSTVSYKVAYRFDGFLQPINDTGHQVGLTTSIFKGGSTVPAKIQVLRADGTVVTPLSAPLWLTPTRGSALSGPVNESVYADPTTSGTTYTLNGNQWHYNWGTKGLTAGWYYRIGVRLDDGNTYYVNIGLR